MKVLDLCCCSGGAAVGISRGLNTTDITGVDIEYKPEYPYNFMQMNLLELSVEFLMQFDFIWASPPCQKYSLACRWNGKEYPDLVDYTRDILNMSGKPYVIENVPQAPLSEDLILCGEMFGLGVIRHRIFEISGFDVLQPLHKMHSGSVIDGDFFTCAGHNKGTIAQWQQALGIDWITDKHDLAQVVPPIYSEFITSFLCNDKAGLKLLKDCPVMKKDSEWLYRQERVLCGKQGCKCLEGKLHGPYWYKYKEVNGKIHKKYIGKNLSIL